MLTQQPDIDCLCVAIGGGGLISGISIAARHLKPAIDIVGVQTDQFPSMYAAFKGVDMPSANATLAEGIAVKQPGDLTVQIVKRLVNDVVLVSEGDIEQAIVMLLEIEKSVVEGAGATGLAAMMRHRERFIGRKVGLILCGGNIDPMVLADIIERGMVRAGRLARIRVHTRDVPGELARAATLIGQAEQILRKSNINARLPRCRSRMPSSSSFCRRAGRSTSMKCFAHCKPRASTPPRIRISTVLRSIYGS